MGGLLSGLEERRVIITNSLKDEWVFILRFRRERARNNPEFDRWHVNIHEVHAEEKKDVVGIDKAFAVVRSRLTRQGDGKRERLS
jgi:hypothetical protein